MILVIIIIVIILCYCFCAFLPYPGPCTFGAAPALPRLGRPFIRFLHCRAVRGAVAIRRNFEIPRGRLSSSFIRLPFRFRFGRVSMATADARGGPKAESGENGGLQ